MASTQITVDKLVYIDRLKSAGVDEPQARVHAEALDQALRDTIATKQDVRDEASRLQQQIEIAVRDLKIWMGGIVVIPFGALASIKYSVEGWCLVLMRISRTDGALCTWRRERRVGEFPTKSS